jgi:hypothetical protein
MRDEMHQNYGTMVGTPTLVTGALVGDTNQALQFDGSTNSMSVPDSVSDSLAIASGGAGGMALELFGKFPSIPGSTKTVIGKAGSYVLEINSAGKLLWTLTGPSTSVTVTSTATIVPGFYYQIVGVYNGDYTGATVFGYQTQGSLQTPILGDFYQGSPTGANNLTVGKYTILEKGQLTSVVMDIQRVFDTTLDEKLRAVVYADSGGAPGRKLGESDEQTLTSAARAWYTFPVDVAVPAGPVWLGFIAGESSGQFQIGYESTGGNHAYKNDSYSGGSADPFGSPAGTDALKLSIYANYTATGRTGAEGKALIYLNGQQDNSSSYTGGIADTANAISFAPSVAVTLDEPSIWNKKLTPVQIATHYAAAISSNPTGLPSAPGGGGGPPGGGGPLYTDPGLYTSSTLYTS